MANITLRKTPETQMPAVERDPFRLLRDMFGWEPYRDMLPAWRLETPIFLPAFEVKETKDAYRFLADVPGVKEADVEITITGNRLTIAGRREAELEEKGETFFVHERTYGAFTRTFALPDGVDVEHIRARVEEGVLAVIVPKKPEVQPKKIPIAVERPKV